MSRTPSLNLLVLAFLLSVAAVSGCSDSAFNTSFVYSAGTLDLMPEAQNGTKDIDGVKALLDKRFGDPQHLEAWLKMPVDFGGTMTTVGEMTTAENGIPVVKLDVEEGKSLPEKAGSIQFVSGACAGETVEISGWNAETGEATLAVVPSQSVASGDICFVDGGTVIQSGRVLYMRHCSHCHGTSGDGNGPTARYLTPKPRDYRNGVFKFTSTNDMSKAAREDVLRVVKYGIPGTYMPSFLLMTDEEHHAIVEYVRFLTLRGEFERKLVAELSSDYSKAALDSRLKDEKKADILKELNEFLADDLKESANSLGDELAEIWATSDSEGALVVPSITRIPDSSESRRRGRELYLSKALNCADCHGIDGAGNGPQTIAFEKNPTTSELYNEPGLHDVWDNLNQPRNLQLGMYRGGRRPIDLFRRIHAGIKGSRMPSFKNTPHEDIWNIVNYILSVPFETEPGGTGIAPSAAAAATVTAPPAN